MCSNFWLALELPEVKRWAYDYSKPGYEDDFVPQTVELKEGEKDV